MADHPVTFLRFDAGTASRFVGDLVALQQEIYADAEPREFFSEDRYRRQLASHMKASGWDLVAAYQGDELVGYAYGFPLQPDTGWWNGLLTTLPDHEITETGHRTFALSELMVRVAWRGRGIGRALHDRLLSARREVRATLLVEGHVCGDGVRDDHRGIRVDVTPRGPLGWVRWWCRRVVRR